MDNRKLAQTTLTISVVLIFSKLSGFLREVALAYSYGTSTASDAFVLAQSVFNIFSNLLFVALGIAFIPIYTKLKLKGKDSEMSSFIDSIYSVAGTMILLICVLGFLGADLLIYLLAPGFSESAHQLAATLTRMILPAVLFTFISTIQGQQLRGENIFMPSAFVAFPLNIALIVAFLFFTPYGGIKGAIVAYVLGTILQVLLLYPFVKKTSYRFHYRYDVHNDGLHKILKLTLPIMLGNTIQVIDLMVNRILASGLEEGSMAALNYSNKLSIFLVGVVSLGVGTICFTRMSELSARNELEELKRFLSNMINLLNLVVVPASIGMMALSVPITKLVFEYGAFDNQSVEMTATTLWFYSIGLTGFVLRDIITKAFYALNDAKTPMINGGIAVGVGIVANIVFVRFLGIGGLALATSVSGILGTVLLLLSLRKKLHQIGLREMSITFLKTCIAGMIMGVSVHLLYRIFYHVIGIMAVALLLAIVCGIFIYSAIILLLRIREVDDFVARLKLKKKQQ